MGLFNRKKKKEVEIEQEVDLSTLTQEERIHRDVVKDAKFHGSDDLWMRFEKKRDYLLRKDEVEEAIECGEYVYVLYSVNSPEFDIIDIDPVVLSVNIESFFKTDVGEGQEEVFNLVEDYARNCVEHVVDVWADFYEEHGVDFEPYFENAAMKAYMAVVQTLFEEKYDFAFYNLDIVSNSGKKINNIKKLTIMDVEIDGKSVPCIWCSHEHKKYNPSIPNSEVAVIVDGPDIKYGFVSNVRKVSSRQVDEMHYAGGINFKKAYHVADEIVPRYTQLQCIMAIARRRGI